MLRKAIGDPTRAAGGLARRPNARRIQPFDGTGRGKRRACTRPPPPGRAARLPSPGARSATAGSPISRRSVRKLNEPIRAGSHSEIARYTRTAATTSDMGRTPNGTSIPTRPRSTAIGPPGIGSELAIMPRR